MGFVADLRHQHQRGRVVAQIDLGPAVGEHQLLQAHLAALAFFHPDDAPEVEPKLLKHLARHAHLAFAAINQHQVGQARAVGLLAAGFEQLAVAAQQHLAHGGVVIARCDAVDVVAPVLRVLHLVAFKHHTRGLCGFTSGVRNVETLDAQGVEFVVGQAQRLGQRPRAGLL